jgi:hypothetical protein
MLPSHPPTADPIKILTHKDDTVTGGPSRDASPALFTTDESERISSAYCVFEYLYRDAGNYKACGALLFEGAWTNEATARLTARLEAGSFFIAEQIGIPALCEELWRQCGCDPSDELDHVWHEFRGLRPASAADVQRLPRWDSLSALLARVEAVEAWDLTQSLNWNLE